MRSISETVQHEVYTGAAKGGHGNQIGTWAAPVSLGIYAFDPGSTGEPELPGHTRVVTKPMLLVPVGTAVKPRDRIIVRGKPFEVDGDTLMHRNPHDPSEDGDEIKLKAVTG